MIFHHRSKNHENTKLQLVLNGKIITHVSSFNFLGLKISENLSWKEHITEIGNKISSTKLNVTTFQCKFGLSFLANTKCYRTGCMKKLSNFLHVWAMLENLGLIALLCVRGAGWAGAQ